MAGHGRLRRSAVVARLAIALADNALVRRVFLVADSRAGLQVCRIAAMRRQRSLPEQTARPMGVR